jgi:hypothetical protein
VEDYSLKFFREHYIDHRGIEGADQELVREAFMGGAHTVMLMFTNAMTSEDPKPLLRQISQELNEFMLIKNAEVQVKGMTVH